MWNPPHGETVTGVLKGYDQLLNLVLDDVEEQVQGGYIIRLHTASCLSDLQIQNHAYAHLVLPFSVGLQSPC
jgi:small nuclear ribonucleoprotein (snRNP)-like protein